MINREYENALLECAEQQPDNPFNWITARNMSRDVLMQNYYMNEMANCIRRNDKVFDYLKGIFYTHSLGKVELNKTLVNEMVANHPILGRLNLLVFNQFVL